MIKVIFHKLKRLAVITAWGAGWLNWADRQIVNAYLEDSENDQRSLIGILIDYLSTERKLTLLVDEQTSQLASELEYLGIITKTASILKKYRGLGYRTVPIGYIAKAVRVNETALLATLSQLEKLGLANVDKAGETIRLLR